MSEEALALDEDTFDVRVRILGPDHPDTLGSRNNLAVSYRSMGRHEEALALDEGTVAAYERVLGPDHPDTFTSRRNLASDYRNLGRNEEADAVEEGTPDVDDDLASGEGE
jgi:hypothetical protein